MSKLLLISNCQTEGTKNALALACPDLEVTAIDIHVFGRDLAFWSESIREYDIVFAMSDVIRSYAEASRARELHVIPTVFFRGFHPDTCYATASGQNIPSPLHDYHSAIALAAYKSGFSPDETIALYADRTYRALGFYDLWESERDSLLKTFKEAGIDGRSMFLRWTRHPSPFMYTFNHPTIDVVYDVAVATARKAEIYVRDFQFRPHDNLATAPMFPIYPEISSRFGYKGGNYVFKPWGTYRTFDLEHFVRASFAGYSQYERDAVFSESPQFAAAMAMFSENR